jgi:hypothetical protein
MRGKQQTTVYIGVDNPLNIIVEGYPCKSLVVETNNGTISKLNDCNFNYHPSKLGPAVFTVSTWKKNKLKKLEEVTWSVIPLPRPRAIVGGFPNLSEIPVAAFKAQGGVVAYGFDEMGFEIKFTVIDFDLMIMKDGVVNFNAHNNGNAFSEETKNGIRSLEPGSHVLITNIWAVGIDMQQMRLSPLEYDMK